MLTLYMAKRDVRQTAEHLHLSMAQVQAARLGMYKRLARAVKGERKMRTSFEIGSPSGRAPADLVRAALSSDDPSHNRAIRENRDAVVSYLDGPEAEAIVGPLLEDGGAELDERVAGMYAALSDDLMDGPDEWVSGFAAALQNAEGDLGRAFGSVLLPGLPENLADLALVFKDAPEVGPEQRDHLAEEPSIMAAGPAARPLLRVGLTPAIVAQATRAVSMHVMEHCRLHGVGDSESVEVWLGKDGSRAVTTREVLDGLDVAKDVEVMIDARRSTSSLLFVWLAEVADHVPLLFDGFQASSGAGTLHLVVTDRSEPDLHVRWRSRRTPRPSSSRQDGQLSYE